MSEKNLELELKRLEEEEKACVFEHFSNEDAWELGKMLVEAAKERGAETAFEIVVNGYTLFRYSFQGADLWNEQWLTRKKNTVQLKKMSTLRLRVYLEFIGKDFEKDWCLSREKYTDFGGGFPIRIKGTGVVGSVCCSGLPHEQDHALVVSTILKYLNKDNK